MLSRYWQALYESWHGARHCRRSHRHHLAGDLFGTAAKRIFPSPLRSVPLSLAARLRCRANLPTISPMKLSRPLLTVVVLLAISTSLFARNQKDEENTSSTSFVVLKDDNGKPVRNAAVVLHPVGKNDKQGKTGFELKTDADGKTHFDGIPFGLLRVQVIAHGFQTFGNDYQINQAEPGNHHPPEAAAGSVFDLRQARRECEYRTQPRAERGPKAALHRINSCELEIGTRCRARQHQGLFPNSITISSPSKSDETSWFRIGPAG